MNLLEEKIGSLVTGFPSLVIVGHMVVLEFVLYRLKWPHFNLSYWQDSIGLVAFL